MSGDNQAAATEQPHQPIAQILASHQDEDDQDNYHADGRQDLGRYSSAACRTRVRRAIAVAA